MIRRMIEIYRFKLVLERNLAARKRARKRARREGKIYIAAHVRRHTQTNREG